MHARLMKETRELLPIFVGTLLLIVVPYLIWHGNAEPFGYIAFGLGCAVLGACSLGNEFQHRTLSLLLSQPISRSVQWRDKMLVLGAGIGTSLAVLVGCQLVYCGVPGDEAPLVLALVGLCALCGAPYWTLVCRRALVGMACAAGVPTSLLGVYALVTARLFADEAAVVSSAVILIILYCAVVFSRGYARFKSLEDYDRTARELSLPASLEAVLAQPLASVSSHFRGPFASLLKKEFRLQQVSFLVAGGFFLLAVVGFCLMPLYRELGQAVVGGDLGQFVLLLPLIAGAIAVAEEKGWDLADWHLTLPPSALQQWSAKMLATLTTSLALGLLLPAALLLASGAVFEPHGSRVSLPPFPALAACVLGQLLVTSVAAYSASFSKSTLRAILAAFGMIVASLGILWLTGTWVSSAFGELELDFHENQLNLVPPVLCVGLLLMLCLTQWFAWSNFRRSGASVRRLVIQLVVIFIAVELISLVSIYAAVLPALGVG